jgi:hypothetical protein
MPPKEVDDAHFEVDLRVQIVSHPPDHFCIQNRRFPRLSGVGGSPPGHSFLANLTNEVA